jgi:hypothetical protein
MANEVWITYDQTTTTRASNSSNRKLNIILSLLTPKCLQLSETNLALMLTSPDSLTRSYAEFIIEARQTLKSNGINYEQLQNFK